MVLSDGDLHKRLPDLEIQTSNPNFPFQPDEQVQPCAIDLRLGDIVWIPRLLRSLFKPIDLSQSSPLGSQITNAFRKTLITSGGFLLRSGQFVLGRTYEAFEIPNDLMGLLTGRSSIGRLGLSVVAPSGLINPGWRGHMPLMLINHSPFDIRLHPYLGIVQLCLSPLSNECEKPYGAAAGSKYLEDDGGPSRYWLDHTVARLQENLNVHKTSDKVAALLRSYAHKLDEPTRKRFASRVDNADVIQDFSVFIALFRRSERRRSVVPVVLGVVMLLLSIYGAWQLTEKFYGLWGIASWLLPLLIAATMACWYQWGTTMSHEDLRQLETKVLEEPPPKVRAKR